MMGWGNMMNGWGYGGYGSGGYGIMGIGMLIFWIGIILLISYLYRRNTKHVYSGAQGRHSGMDILNERYARGEINSAEYLSRKHDLEGR